MNSASYARFARSILASGEGDAVAEGGARAFALGSAPRAATPPMGEAEATFLAAHDEVVKLEIGFGEAEPDLAIALVQVDGAYRRARGDLMARVGEGPAIGALTGDVPEPDAARAVAELCAQLRGMGEARWARRHLQGPLGALPGPLERAIERLAEARDLEEARAARACAFGPAAERLALRLDGLARVSSPVARAPFAATAPSWTNAVVVVWNDDLKTRRGSGVFIRSNLVVTAAHVISAGGDPKLDRVHVSISGAGSSLPVLAIPYFGEKDGEDCALLRVPATGVGALTPWYDYEPADGTSVHCAGNPVSGGSWVQAGHVSRDQHILFTSDVHAPHGASGGAVTALIGARLTLVGIVTHDEPSGYEHWPVGIPLPADMGG